MVKVLMKWGKERYEMDACTDDTPLQLKSQIFSLTGVKPDRQKVLIKGKVLGDSSWDGFELKDGTLMMMIGSGAELPVAPVRHGEEAAQLENQEDSSKPKLPVGLRNLGNTCYMNATMQCLKTIPELREALEKFAASLNTTPTNVYTMGGTKALTLAARDLFKEMDNFKPNQFLNSFIPAFMVRVLHKQLPQFAIRGENGFMQQDANECWVEMIRAFQTELKVNPNDPKNLSFISTHLEGVFTVEMKNLESDEEPVKVSTENFSQLSCFLSQETRYLHSGIKNTLTEQVTKHSDALGRDAKYERKALISRLPAYLSIQMVRFFYKEKDKVNAKILKDVKFPLILDVYDICTPELQKKLIPARDAFKEEEDRKLEAMRLEKTGDAKVEESVKETEEKHQESTFFESSFADDLGSNNSGYYELQAIVTHKGRSSSSGHYVGWVRINDKQWAMCDDDEIRSVSPEEILALSGGGDWHCAYVMLYGPRLLKKPTTIA